MSIKLSLGYIYLIFCSFIYISSQTNLKTNAKYCSKPIQLINFNTNLAFEFVEPYSWVFSPIDKKNTKQFWCINNKGLFQSNYNGKYVIYHVSQSSHCQNAPCYLYSFSYRNDLTDTGSFYNWNINLHRKCGNNNINTITFDYNEKGVMRKFSFADYITEVDNLHPPQYWIFQ